VHVVPGGPALTGLGQAGDAHPRAFDGRGFAEFDDGDVVVERAEPEVRVPVDFGHVMHGLAAGVDLPVVFPDGHGEIFGTEAEKRTSESEMIAEKSVTRARARARRLTSRRSARP